MPSCFLDNEQYTLKLRACHYINVESECTYKSFIGQLSHSSISCNCPNC